MYLKKTLKTFLMSLMLYSYCSQIPHIPEQIINLTEEQIRQIPDKFDGVEASKYTLHNATQELKDFLQPYFSNEIDIAFQLITDDLPIHKDFGRTSCYNYIIQSGGEASTVWYDDNLKEIDRVVFPTGIWHHIDVGRYHNVVDVIGTRISITVWTRDENAVGEIKI